MTDTSVMQDRIGQLCGQFKLPTMGAQSVARFTAAGHGDALPILLEVLEQEAEDRRHRRIKRLRRESRLPSGRPGKSSSIDRMPLALRQQLDQLAQAASWSAASTCWLLGCPGTGKTHALCALGHRLVEAGHSVLFARVPTAWCRNSSPPSATLDLPRQLRKLDNFDFLLLADLGYLPQGARGVRGPLHPHRRTLRAQIVGHHVKPGLLGVGAASSPTPWPPPRRLTGSCTTPSSWSLTSPMLPDQCCPATGPGQGGEPAKLIDANRQI